MKRKGNKRANNGGRRKKNMPPVPPPGLVTYKGRIPRNISEDGIVVPLRSLTQVFTGAAATTLLLVQAPDVTSFDNFSEYSTVFQEYRVLGVQYEYFPTKYVNTTTLELGVLTHAIVHSPINPAITTLADAISYGDCQVACSNKPWLASWKMTSTEEALFQGVTTANTDISLVVFGSNMTINTTYGFIIARALVQFRTTRK
jgi:hypothetical protein